MQADPPSSGMCARDTLRAALTGRLRTASICERTASANARAPVARSRVGFQDCQKSDAFARGAQLLRDFKRDVSTRGVPSNQIRSMRLQRANLPDISRRHGLDPIQGRLVAVEFGRLVRHRWGARRRDSVQDPDTAVISPLT